MTFDININNEDKNMNSEEFDIEVIRNVVDFLNMMNCKLSHDYEIAYDAENIIDSCICDLESLIER